MDFLQGVVLPDIKMNDHGTAVKLLQILLNSMNYTCGAVDGIAGIKTMGRVLEINQLIKLGSSKCTIDTWRYIINHL